ncbi:hypothetical protein BHM03_00011561 [Ensete ventricosum]|nr:hypothetical protein BHM03_00011561 [Ensete ventricosum]
MSGAGQDEDKKPADPSAHINLKVKSQINLWHRACGCGLALVQKLIELGMPSSEFGYVEVVVHLVAG